MSQSAYFLRQLFIAPGFLLLVAPVLHGQTSIARESRLDNSERLDMRIPQKSNKSI